MINTTERPMIPNTIHYIWLGDIEKLPELGKVCINTWHENLVDFEIILWDESKIRDVFSVDKLSFFNSMLEKKKYAFAADFARCIILNEFGGIYLDTDVEVVKNLAPLLNDCSVFMGLEDVNKPNCAVIGATKNNIFLERLIQLIIKADGLVEIPKLAYEALISVSPEFSNVSGYKKIKDIIIYPEEYFYPYNPYKTGSLGQLLYKDITINTYAIHHWAKSWKLSFLERIRRYLMH